MAERRDLDFTYSLTDRVIRLSLGELTDFSGAKYDGDFTLSLRQAQRRKHEYIAEQIGIAPGRRVLDLGCGWGGLLEYVRGAGAIGVGVTLSSAQAAACRRHGLDVHIQDARELTRETFGGFDAVASLGAFEHFCSPEDHAAGRQEDIYRGIFERIAGVLAPSGRFYLQTMVFGPNAVALEKITTARHGTPTPGSSPCWAVSSPARGSPPAVIRSFGARSLTFASSPRRAAAPTTSRRSISGTSGSELRASEKHCSSCTASPLAGELGLPARFHLGRERQPGLLRARAAGPLPDGVRARVAPWPPRRRIGAAQAGGEGGGCAGAARGARGSRPAGARPALRGSGTASPAWPRP